jgi:hypothetical protein
MMPLALSDSELDIVFAAARPLQVADRDPFLRETNAVWWLAVELLGTGRNRPLAE